MVCINANIWLPSCNYWYGSQGKSVPSTPPPSAGGNGAFVNDCISSFFMSQWFVLEHLSLYVSSMD